MPAYRPAPERFWEKVSVSTPDQCWNWTASTYTSGYGQFGVGKKLTGAHRFSYALAYGPIPDGMYVLHHCDNKLCCNPSHLFLGTQKDNMNDLHAKGLNGQPRGERQRSAKFTDEQVKQIRATFAAGNHSHAQLAREIGVSTPTIRSIVQRRTWTHI